MQQRELHAGRQPHRQTHAMGSREMVDRGEQNVWMVPAPKRSCKGEMKNSSDAPFERPDTTRIAPVEEITTLSVILMGFKRRSPL
jgi:hypothetical protein